MDLHIAHLYPDLMNIYGDRGNVIALSQRAKWRGIDVEVRPYSIGEWADPEWPDVWFFGGGQDQGQDIVGADLAGKNGAALRKSVEGGAAILSVCGGYQLLGHEYVPETGPSIPGVGILDVRTRAGKRRFVGNLLVDSPDGQLVGFENHSGRTYLGSRREAARDRDRRERKQRRGQDRGRGAGESHRLLSARILSSEEPVARGSAPRVGSRSAA